MRVIFLYVQHKASPGVAWNPKQKATNYYSKRITEEGYYWMLKRMVETKIIDELVCVVESGRGQGKIEYQKNIEGWVLPDIKELQKHLRPDDIIFVRGGWKSWHDPLIEIQEAGHKLLVYAANTGRERWKFWDVVFNDLTGDNKFDARDRFQFDFHKPINPLYFYHKRNTELKYDLCIGASNIHDKKGQYLTINALLKYKEIFGENLKCVMPGAFRSSANTERMINILDSEKLDVLVPGEIDRCNLNAVLNRSKFFIHLGGGGQGDRGPIEAMKCGCQLLLGNNRRHHKTLYQNKGVCHVFLENDGIEEVARTLFWKVKSYNPKKRKGIADYYERKSGIETVILPEMNKLFRRLEK